MSNRSLVGLVLIALILTGGCGLIGGDGDLPLTNGEIEPGDSSTNDNSTDNESDDAQSGDEPSSEGQSSEGQSSEGQSSEDQSSGANSIDVAANGLGCGLLDGGVFFEVELANDSDSFLNYAGPVQFFADDVEVHTTEISLAFVRPAERVKQRFFVAGPAELVVDRCSANQIVEAEPFVGPTRVAALDDVSQCQDLRRSERDTFAYELTVTNPSLETPASYTINVAIVDPDGVRRGTRLVLSDNRQGLFEELAPGASATESDESLTQLPYTEGYTCEVASAFKTTTATFFDSTDDNGARVGSLNADLGFATGSAELADEAFLVLGPVVDQITSNTTVCVEGYADSVGSDEDNLQLSQARANAVADYLQTLTQADITAVGRGEIEATADEVDDPALRRVDITLAACPAS